MITRGTRGDVQPFLALALGLATSRGWDIVICTEDRYKSFIEEYSAQLHDDEKHGRNRGDDDNRGPAGTYARPRIGSVTFASSGGDTMKSMEGTVAKLAINSRTSFMQSVMLASSGMDDDGIESVPFELMMLILNGFIFDTERFFFGSAMKMTECALDVKPDFVIYGFTTTTIGLLLGERLGVPALGVILQPTVIPSRDIEPIIGIPDTHTHTYTYTHAHTHAHAHIHGIQHMPT